MAKKPLEIDACAGSQLRDTQGEMLSVEGADISELQAGKGRWNDNHGKGFFNSIGRITHAKKIFKAEDCEDDRQKYYWEKVKAPYVYVKGYLYDDEDHPNARAAAAILRNIHKSDVPLKLKASVEGGVMARGIADPTLLARTKIHSVALTFTPANNATLVEPLSLDKSAHDEATDMQLIKSVMHLAETNVPSFRHIARDAGATKIINNIEKIASLLGNNELIVPTKQAVLQHALETKIKDNVEKVHELMKFAAKEEIEKSWKGALTGAALAGASLLTPSQEAATPVRVRSVYEQPARDVREVANENSMRGNKSGMKFFSDNKHRFSPLKSAMAFHESSNGAQFTNKKDSDGQMAGGIWQIKPSTVYEALKNNKPLQAKYPDLYTMSKHWKTHGDHVTNTLSSDHQISSDIMDAHLANLKRRYKNPAKAIYAHRHGEGALKQAIEGGKSIADDSYVKSVLETANKQLPKREKVKKALTAGYGGGGAPTSLSGGGVFQTESLDSGNGKGFKYVTCDECGKEQIYAKFQVKCRDCGKSWNLEKLHKIMCGKTK